MDSLTTVFSAGYLGGSELFNLEFLRRAHGLGVEIDAIVPTEGTVADALRSFSRSLRVVELPPALAKVSRFDRRIRVSSLPGRLIALRQYGSSLRLALEQTSGPLCCLGFRSQLAVAVAGWRSSRRVCWVVHEVVPLGPFNRLWSIAASRVDAIFAYSQAAASQPALMNARACVLPVRLELDQFFELPLPKPPPRVLGLVGDLHPIKNHLGFVDVIQRLRRAGEPVEGRLFGRDTSAVNPTADYVERVRDATGADVNLVEVEPREIPSRFAELDALLHMTTVPETFGRVCVEAMAAGRPVVGFNHGGVSEIVSAEQTGILCPANDLWAVVAAIQRLRREPELYTRLSETARRVACERWGPGQMGPFIGDALAAFSRGRKLEMCA
jgi:glycosyltransferase involved in cell wall biosynthesis